MAQLWVATNEATGAEVCVKILVPETERRRVGRALPPRGVRRGAPQPSRDRPHLRSRRARTRAARTTNGKPAALAIVMELLHGETLGDYLMKKGKLSARRGDRSRAAVPLRARARAPRGRRAPRSQARQHLPRRPTRTGTSSRRSSTSACRRSPQPAITALRRRAQAAHARRRDARHAELHVARAGARRARRRRAERRVLRGNPHLHDARGEEPVRERERSTRSSPAIMQREPPRLPGVPDAIWDVIEKCAREGRAATATPTRPSSGSRCDARSGVRRRPTPACTRSIVRRRARARSSTPLGGDSHVSVPPVGNAEPATRRATHRRSRRRVAGGATARVRIVVGVVGGVGGADDGGAAARSDGLVGGAERRATGRADRATASVAPVEHDGGDHAERGAHGDDRDRYRAATGARDARPRRRPRRTVGAGRGRPTSDAGASGVRPTRAATKRRSDRHA